MGNGGAERVGKGELLSPLVFGLSGLNCFMAVEKARRGREERLLFLPPQFFSF